MDFSQVEVEFKKLKGQLEAGTITEAEFKARLAELMIQDEQGRWWMIGYETGQWYYHDGETWVRGEPLQVAVPAPPPPPVEKPTEARRIPMPGGIKLLWIGGGIGALTLLVVLVVALVRPGGPSGPAGPTPKATELATVAVIEPTATTRLAILPTPLPTLPPTAILPTPPPTLPPTAILPTPPPTLPPTVAPSTKTPMPPSPSTRISFVSQRSGRDEIYVMDANGANLTRLATGFGPAWSPDGKRMAFVSVPGVISVINADGTGLRKLTDKQDWQPTWSPDGQRIAFVSEREGTRQIYVMDANGENQVRLTAHPFHDRHPSWSPNGRKIAFISNRSGRWQIWVMDPNGANQTMLTDGPLDHFLPVWSPNSRKIAFGVWTGQRNEIWVMDADGTHATMLTADSVYVLEGSGAGLSWSPSDWIAFVSDRDGNPEIYAVQADGTGLVRITDHPAKDFNPTWLR